jgi:hypothetical protein
MKGKCAEGRKENNLIVVIRKFIDKNEISVKFIELGKDRIQCPAF